MYGWKGKIAEELELARADVEAITTKYPNELKLQTYVYTLVGDLRDLMVYTLF